MDTTTLAVVIVLLLIFLLISGSLNIVFLYYVTHNPPASHLEHKIKFLEAEVGELRAENSALKQEAKESEERHKLQINDLYGQITSLSILFNEKTGGKFNIPGRINEGNERVLREKLSNSFNYEELKTLGADVGIDYEELPSNLSFIDFVREFVSHAQRHSRTPILLAELKRRRPEVDWPGIN